MKRNPMKTTADKILEELLDLARLLIDDPPDELTRHAGKQIQRLDKHLRNGGDLPSALKNVRFPRES